ncbi:MAG: hypothetical protein ACJ72Z_08150 [Pyrinomonadaceae bacterium]
MASSLFADRSPLYSMYWLAALVSENAASKMGIMKAATAIGVKALELIDVEVFTSWICFRFKKEKVNPRIMKNTTPFWKARKEKEDIKELSPNATIPLTAA